jgi:hypothetical protein
MRRNNMSTIKRLQIKNFLGVDELGLDPAKINIFKGPQGSGKSSIIEGIEKAFTNKNRRTEIIKHGTDEATLYLELNDGLEIDRRIRTDKADYLKIRKGDEGVPSTEKFLRSLINGDIFRPIDWVGMSSKEQTKSILNMLQIEWSHEDIEKWFGEIPSNIDFNQHILMVLKAIETKYFKNREEVHRAIKELKTQIKVIMDELPADYDGEVWRDKKVQEYYAKVKEAQDINKFIEQAKLLQENFENKVKSIESDAESSKARIEMKYKDQGQDIKDIIDLSKNKIEKSKIALENSDKDLEMELKESVSRHKDECQKIDNELQNKLDVLEEEYMQKVAEANNLHTAKKNELDENLVESKEALEKLNITTKEAEKDNISLQENKIAVKNQELNSLDDLKKQELKAVDEKVISEVEKEEIRVGKAAEYIKKHKPVDIEPLQDEADKVADMQSYLRQWDMMLDIRDNKLSDKERYSADLTAKIDKARTLPGELLKTAQMPIEGISVDSEGSIRINGTLIGGLSDGERLQLSMKIAKAQAGDLKIICIDRFESLNPAAQEELLKEISKDQFQYFITSTESDEFQVEKID